MKACELCGQEFEPTRTRKRFCSHGCACRNNIKKAVRYGAENNKYNGGWCQSQGRAMVVCRDGSMMLWYRIVMENELGRPLRSDEIVHHVNGDHTDDRPENLRVMTQSEHALLHVDVVLRGQRRAAELRRAKTHCKHGHPFDEANTYVGKNGSRRCRACARQREREKRQRQAA